MTMPKSHDTTASGFWAGSTGSVKRLNPGERAETGDLWWSVLDGQFLRLQRPCKVRSQEVVYSGYDMEPQIVKWAKKATSGIRLQKVEGGWYAAHPACPGAWAQQDTADAAYEECCRALEDWAVLRYRSGQPLPNEKGQP